MNTEEDTFKTLKMPPRQPIDHWYAEYCNVLGRWSGKQKVYSVENTTRFLDDFLYNKGWRFSELFEIKGQDILWKTQWIPILSF